MGINAFFLTAPFAAEMTSEPITPIPPLTLYLVNHSKRLAYYSHRLQLNGERWEWVNNIFCHLEGAGEEARHDEARPVRDALRAGERSRRRKRRTDWNEPAAAGNIVAASPQDATRPPHSLG